MMATMAAGDNPPEDEVMTARNPQMASRKLPMPELAIVRTLTIGVRLGLLLFAMLSPA